MSASGVRVGNLYTLKFEIHVAKGIAAETTTDDNLLHRRFGHSSMESMKTNSD